ncbi:MAG: hypothetical protein ACREFP_17745 [Acetobacteraceae bacterium]
MGDREKSTTAAVLDCQIVEMAEAGGPCGYDTDKKVLDRVRQVLVGTGGRGPASQVQWFQCKMVTVAVRRCVPGGCTGRSLNGHFPMPKMPVAAWPKSCM